MKITLATALALLMIISERSAQAQDEIIGKKYQ
jgi:hypothetical protein